MAKRTYSDVVQQIQKLQAEAEALKQAEVNDVVARIRDAVEVYGLTPEDIFGRRQTAASRGRKAVAAKVEEAKYGDGKGNTWGGRGPRPRWLRDALASGASLESFLLNASGAPSAEAAGAGARKQAGRRTAAKRGGAAKAARGTRRAKRPEAKRQRASRPPRATAESGGPAANDATPME